MPKRLFTPPDNLIKQWPEVFEGLYMNTMPVAYLDYIRLEFSNGRIWEIDIREQIDDRAMHIISDRIIETFYEYKDEIAKIDFKIDIEKLKKDIAKSSKNIL